MTRRSFLILLSLVLLVVPVFGGELPQVLQPNTTAYSPAEVATLTHAIASLEDILNDYSLGSRRYFTSNEWNRRDFAAYTAGTLEEMGYETKLVSQNGWPDGAHVWVLVGIPLGVKTAWIPVEASPEMGHSQQILGHISSYTDASGNLWFDLHYLDFSEVVDLSATHPPIAKIRPPSPPVETNEGVKFLAIGSYDPDGKIVLYKWDFGDGKTKTSTTGSIRHEFRRQGSYTVSLTVIDNRGKSAITNITLRVVELEPEPEPPPSGGCGCGG